MTDHAVLIAGGGPTGLMLAGELALAGVDVAILERRTNQDLIGWRALGFHARTIEVLDQRGIAERFIKEARGQQTTGFSRDPTDISDFPTRHDYGLGLPQKHIERILADWVDELGVPTLRGCEVTGFAQDEARASTSSSLTARRCARNTSSAATEAAAWSARRPGSSSRAGTRPAAA